MNGTFASAGEDASAEGVKAPETPHKTSKKGAKAGNAASKKRQSHIDEMLHKTRRGTVAKTGKPIKTTALADALSGEKLLKIPTMRQPPL